MSSKATTHNTVKWKVETAPEGDQVRFDFSHPRIGARTCFWLELNSGLFDSGSRELVSGVPEHVRTEVVTFTPKLQLTELDSLTRGEVVRVFAGDAPRSMPSMEKLVAELEKKLASATPDVGLARAKAKRTIGEIYASPSRPYLSNENVLLAFSVDTVRACSCIHCKDRPQGPVRYVYLVPRVDGGSKLSPREKRLLENLRQAVVKVSEQFFSLARNEPRCVHAAVMKALNTAFTRVPSPPAGSKTTSFALKVRTFFAPHQVWDVTPVVISTMARTGLSFDHVAGKAHDILPDVAAEFMGPFDLGSFLAFTESSLRRRLLNDLPRFRTRVPVTIFRALIAHVLSLGRHELHGVERSVLLRAIRVELEVMNGVSRGKVRKSSGIGQNVWIAARDIASFLCGEDEAWLTRSQIVSFFGDDLFDRPVARKKAVKTVEERMINIAKISPGVGRILEHWSPSGAYIFTASLYHGQTIEEMCEETGISIDIIERVMWADKHQAGWTAELEAETLARLRRYCEPLHDVRLGPAGLCRRLVDNAVRLHPCGIRGLKTRHKLMTRVLKIVGPARPDRSAYDSLTMKQTVDLARALGRVYSHDHI
jgi:hypothetical protein